MPARWRSGSKVEVGCASPTASWHHSSSASRLRRDMPGGRLPREQRRKDRLVKPDRYCSGWTMKRVCRGRLQLCEGAGHQAAQYSGSAAATALIGLCHLDPLGFGGYSSSPTSKKQSESDESDQVAAGGLIDSRLTLRRRMASQAQRDGRHLTLRRLQLSTEISLQSSLLPSMPALDVQSVRQQLKRETLQVQRAPGT